MVVSLTAASPAFAQGPVRQFGGTLVQSLDAPSGPGSDYVLTKPKPKPKPKMKKKKKKPRRDRVLSNERTLSRWAHSGLRGWIYARPTPRARRVARIRLFTEDGFREVYLLLRSHWDRRGRQWIKLRIPMRPNGRVGWVRRDRLGAIRATRRLLVLDRRRLRISYFNRGRRRWSAPVGIGKPSTPTPAGRFWIRERFRILDRGSGYYPYAFGTADYSTLSEWPGGGVIGIHGPYGEPNRIPGRPSHGCIRMRVADDAWLAHHVGIGTPLRIKS